MKGYFSQRQTTHQRHTCPSCAVLREEVAIERVEDRRSLWS